MPNLRVNFPETLPGAMKFSGEEGLNDAIHLIRAFKAMPSISDPLFEAVRAMAPGGGRPRLEGEWILVAIALIVSRQGDIQPFHDRASMELWQACGFERRPGYSTVHDRLTELENAIPAIEDAIGRMVRHSIEVEPRIGRHVHIDGTEAETHSRCFHDCREDEYCAWRKDGETVEDVNERVLGRSTTATAQKRRQEEDAGEVTGEAEETAISSEPASPKAANSSRGPALRRVRTSNHSWLTHDPDAGFRSYTKPNGTVESWHGFYHSRAVDDFTGLTLYGLVTSSSKTEHSQYESLLEGISRSMNSPEAFKLFDDDEASLIQALTGDHVRLPEAILGDRGYAYPFIHEMNTRLGILTVTPWRKFPDGRDQPTETTLVGSDGTPVTVDRHGIIRCKHCGGPTKRVEFRRADGETPRIYAECILPSAPGSPCNKKQSVSCALDWRMLRPLELNNERYLALESRFQFERAHHMGRVRNRNGGKDPILRPKRLGLPWQQLLLTVATMVDWLRAGLKHGWLQATRNTFQGYKKRVTDGIKKARTKLDDLVRERARELRNERHHAGLDSCWPPEPEPPPPKPGA
jgi:hypothetical protein